MYSIDVSIAGGGGVTSISLHGMYLYLKDIFIIRIVYKYVYIYLCVCVVSLQKDVYMMCGRVYILKCIDWLDSLNMSFIFVREFVCGR
jgi:hypothetical protein